MPRSLVEQVRAFAEDAGLWGGGDHILVACSGGGDSVALACIMAELRRNEGGGVSIGHVHHGTRGDENDRDEESVRSLAADLGFPFLSHRVDVPASHNSGSLQATARRLRYGALRDMARSTGATRVATAHTEDDRAETLLLNLARGAGLEGLSSLRAIRGDGVVRPLLEVPRAALRQWLRGHGRAWREDPSNRDRRYRRSRVRHELIPWLEESLNPRALPRIAQAARSLELASLALAELIGRALEDVLLDAPSGELRLDGARLASYTYPLRLLVVRQACAEFAGAGWRAPSGRVESVLDGLDASSPRTIQLGPHFHLSVGPVDVRLHRGTAVGTLELPETVLAFDQWVRVGAWSFRMTLAEKGPGGARMIKSPYVTYLGRLKSPVRVRSRRPGDRFRPLGGPGSRKLSDFMIDRGIPRQARPSVPILVDEIGILWVVGHRVDARAVADGTQWTRVEATPPLGSIQHDG